MESLLRSVEVGRRTIFKDKKFFVIGGSTIYRQFLELGIVHEIYQNSIAIHFTVS